MFPFYKQEFWLRKFWRMHSNSPKSPKYSPAKIFSHQNIPLYGIMTGSLYSSFSILKVEYVKVPQAFKQ